MNYLKKTTLVLNFSKCGLLGENQFKDFTSEETKFLNKIKCESFNKSNHRMNRFDEFIFHMSELQYNMMRMSFEASETTDEKIKNQLIEKLKKNG